MLSRWLVECAPRMRVIGVRCSILGRYRLKSLTQVVTATVKNSATSVSVTGPRSNHYKRMTYVTIGAAVKERF